MRRHRLADALLALATAATVTGTLAAASGGQASPAAAATTTYTVYSPFRTLWSAQRATLGQPTSGTYTIPGATAQNFQGGRMYRGATGEVIALSNAELSGFVPADGAVAYALDQLGEAYVFGAEGPAEWDCSGLTQRAYAFAGKKIPRKSGDQAAALPTVATPAPGDLLWWPGHVGIYLGVKDGRPMMVNATWHQYAGVWRKGVLVLDPTTRDGGVVYEAHRSPLR